MANMDKTQPTRTPRGVLVTSVLTLRASGLHGQQCLAGLAEEGCLLGVVHSAFPDARTLVASVHCSIAGLGWLGVDGFEGEMGFAWQGAWVVEDQSLTGSGGPLLGPNFQ